MKRSEDVSSPLIPIETALATGTVTMAAAALCPPLLPFALITGFLFRRLAREGVARDVDRVAADSADDLACEWEKNRQPGERGVDVSATLYSGGALFDLPMTRTYRYELDEND